MNPHCIATRRTLPCAALAIATSIAGFASAAEPSAVDLRSAVESVLREHPQLIVTALERDPVAVADLVDRAAELRKARAEEAQWQAQRADPKLPEIAADRPIRGARKAPITIVEYSDFECPYCRAASATLHDVLAGYGESVRLVVKHIPLGFHAAAEPAARYFEAIALQSEVEAWRFHDRVFEQQRQLSRGVDALKEIAAGLAIDQARLERDLHGETVTQRLAADRAEAQRFGFDGTPAFLINGVSLIGNHPKRDFDRLIERLLAEGHARAE